MIAQVDRLYVARVSAWPALLGAAAVLLCACSGGADGATSSGASSTDGVSTGVAAASSSGAQPERAGPVDVGDGREIYLECHGTGSPTVVLVSGLGNGADIWSTSAAPAPSSPAASTGVSEAPVDPAPPTVYGDVGTFTRVCAYDRPGTSDSRSTEVPQPTSARTSADDLEKLLTAAGEAPPYVLAGHSYGGPIIRVFAGEHPDQVGGLVLVDALSEDLAANLTPEQVTLLEALNAPSATRPGAEAIAFSTVFADVRQSPPPPDVPVSVLTADIPQLTPEVLASGQVPPGVDQQFADALWTAQLAAQDELAAKFPGAVHVTDTHSDHYIQLGNPQLVIDSIRAVVDDVREGDAGG